MGEGRRDERTSIPLKFCLVSGKALDEPTPPWLLLNKLYYF
jgi:hypothetical protein